MFRFNEFRDIKNDSIVCGHSTLVGSTLFQVEDHIFNMEMRAIADDLAGSDVNITINLNWRKNKNIMVRFRDP